MLFRIEQNTMEILDELEKTKRLELVIKLGESVMEHVCIFICSYMQLQEMLQYSHIYDMILITAFKNKHNYGKHLCKCCLAWVYHCPY